MPYPHLFEPLRIGSVTCRNRIMQLATTNNLDAQGLVADRQVAFYEERAKGGVGLIVTEGLAAHVSTQATHGTSLGRGRVGAYDPRATEGLRRLADALHGHGVPVIGQVYHGGRQHHADIVPLLWGPSPVPCPHSGGVPHEMTRGEIAGLVEGFAEAAAMLEHAGFDGVEIHGAQGHLIQEFFSRFSNHRTDEYGGSFDNRMRIGLEIIDAVHRRCGADFVVGMRLGAEERSPEGIDMEQACRIAERIADHGGVHYLSITVGNFHSIEIHTPDRHHERMEFVGYSSAVRKVVAGLPVVACGRIIEPEAAEGILANGDADLIGLCRPLLADAEWPRKASEGRDAEIRRCISCNQCWGSIIAERSIMCIHNAATGRELEWGIGTLEPAATRKRVVVVGGGPAGMEAARVAAARGHEVSLWERDDELGGAVRYPSRIPGHEETRYVIDHLVDAVERAGVDVRLAADATAESLLAAAPDAVVMATGSEPRRDGLGDTGDLPVFTSYDVAAGRAALGARVVLFDEDGYYQACETAEMAARSADQILMVTNFFEVGREIPATSRITTLRALDLAGVRLVTTSWFKRVEGRDVIVEHVLSGRESRIEDVDSIVHVGHNRARDELARALDGRVAELHCIGDAYMPRRIADAVTEGHRAGRAL